jgi:hypothetical protein
MSSGYNPSEIPTVAFVNKATVDLGVDFERMVNALQYFLSRHFYPIWGRTAQLILAENLLPSTWGIVFTDDADVAEALGYHDYTPQGYPLSHVFVKPTIQSGKSVSVTASHELVEMIINPGLAHGVLGPDGQTFFAREVADACQEHDWTMPEYKDILLTNFVYPSYFESFRRPHSIKFDQLRKISKPFQILKGGYMPVFKNGTWGPLFSDKRTESTFKQHHHSRTAKMMKDRLLWKPAELKTMANPDATVKVAEEVPLMPAKKPSKKDVIKETKDVSKKEVERDFVEKSKQRAISLGFDWDEIRKAVNDFGPEILDLAEEASEQGFTITFIQEVIQKVGMPGLKLLMDYWHDGREFQSKMKSLLPGVPSNVEGVLLPFMVKKYLLPQLEKMLPEDLKPLVEEYGEVIVTHLLNLILAQASHGAETQATA